MPRGVSSCRYRPGGWGGAGLHGFFWLAMLLAVSACSPSPSGKGEASPSVDVPGRAGASKTAAVVRAERRLFDGAPPTVPHAAMGAACTSCHNEEGMAVESLGFSPPSPHGKTPGMGALLRCEQCHVYATAATTAAGGQEELFSGNTFVGLRQDLRRGPRLNTFAPPVMPHAVLMRENCAACHTGPAAREEIRTTHPERVRCQQCHVVATTADRSPFDGL